MRRRSRTVRAAALVTLGLGVTACDDTPPDLPGQTEARLDACRAAHRRLGEDPARCDALEQVIAREQATGRPTFTTVAACESTFGRGACEGETLASTPPTWRPALAGWAAPPDNPNARQPVVQDRESRYWALREAVQPIGGTIGTQAAPRNVQAADLIAMPGAPAAATYAFLRVAPIYPDEASCSAEWRSCTRSDIALPNRFGTQEACRANWSQCVEVELPESALTLAVADNVAPPQGSSSSTTSGGVGGTGGVRPGWWVGYNSGYRQNYAGGIGPRYQGWTWTGDRQPVAAYRPATGTGPLQAWDSGSRRLGAAARMASYADGSSVRGSSSGVSRPASTVSRAGFGSTGRSYSSGG